VIKPSLIACETLQCVTLPDSNRNSNGPYHQKLTLMTRRVTVIHLLQAYSRTCVRINHRVMDVPLCWSTVVALLKYVGILRSLWFIS